MEMSPNTSSSALLLHFMCLLLLLTPITQTTDSAPTLAPSLLTSTTLLFDSGAPGSGLRNCSCPAHVQDCDEALANSLCRCHTVVRSALPPPAGLRGPGRLTVWVKELWVLEELLNNSMVGHLHLSFCGIKPMNSQYLALMGLQTLRIHSAAPEASYRDQEISLLPVGGAAAELDALSFDLSSSSHLTILDVGVLNGLSALKAYSVVGPPAPELSQNFPLLATPFSPGKPLDPGLQAADPLQKLLITFVY